MANIYYNIFAIAFPIMCLFTYIVIAITWFFVNRKADAKAIVKAGAYGAVLGYIISFAYFYVTRDVELSRVLHLSYIGILVGAGYSMIIYSILPNKLKHRIK